MLKKFVISLLLVMIIACGMGISSTIAYAADGEVTEETNIAVNYKVASYKIDGSYTANTPIEFKDGDAVVGALKIDKTPDKAGFGVKLVSGSTFSFVPNANYKVTKLIYALTSTNYVNFNTPDAKYGTKFDDLTDADVELLRQVGINANKSDSFGAELNVNHTATEEDPYKFKIGNALEFGTICVVYEKLPITETIYPVVSHSNKWLNAGDIQVGLMNTGYGDRSSGTTISNSSQIIIKSTPGYIITSVVLKSPSADKMLKLSYLTGAEDLSVVNEELSFTITGFEAGQDYTFGNKSDFYWYVKEITITYEEHVHAPEGLTPNYDDTKHWDDCICGAVVNAEAHGFVEGEITKQPGNGLPGEQLQTCQVCSAEVIKYLPCPITDSAITVELANQLACNGTEQAQKVSIKVGDVVLEEGVDYTLSNNLQTNAGDYTLTITGIGKYSGERTLGFTIEKGIIARPMSDSSFPEYDGTAQNFWIKPDNTRYTISGNRQTEVGTYVAEVTLTEEAYANYRWEETTEPTITYEFEITKGKVNLPSTRTTTFTYNGQEQTYYISTNSRYTISGDSRTQTNAGTYTITVSLNDPDNYQWKNGTEGNLTYLFVINKINVPMPVADPTVFTYNGQAQTYALQENNLYTISGTTFTNAGNHTITVSLVDKTNYQWESGNSNDLEYSFVIGKATYDMSGVVFADKVVDYDGNAYSLEVKNLPSGVTVAYENNAQTNAGEYTITAKFTGDADNYNLIDNKTATLIINKLNVEKPTADSGVYTYNGEEQTYALQASDLYNILDNKGTNAGNYTVKVVLKDKTNYQWESGNSNDLEYSFVIGKATYDMSGVVFANKTVVYNGTAFSIEATNLPIGVTVAYENNGKTDVGEYTITAIFTGNANYNAIANKTATLTINKATYDMSGVVFANKTVVYNGTAFSIEATNLPTGVTVAYENNGKTETGEYTITAIFTANANYNAIANKTATLTINKATYDMSGVVFANKTVTYNGNAFSIEATNLPTGVTVAYENNGKTDVGIYTITAIFTGNENYNAIANKTATLTINKDSLTFNTDTENQILEDVVISSPAGINPTNVLVVEKVKETHNYAEFINKNQKVAIAYDIKLLKDGATVQPDGTLQFRVLIPEELRSKDFSIIHIHNGNETSVIEYQIDGDYVVFESDKLSDFVFVYDMSSILWVIILLGVIALFEIAFLMYLLKKNKKFKSKKLMSAYPPFLFGMFIAEWQIVLVIVLAVAVIALAIVSIIFATKVINRNAKIPSKDEEIALAKSTSDEPSDEGVEDSVDKKDGRVIKSFLERLDSCPSETIEYYNAIKNELLSYKNVKSKISFKHESFRLGMPIVARLKIRGKSLYLYLALDPEDYKETKYKVKDMSEYMSCKAVPTMYKINLPRRAEYGKQLIGDLMNKLGVEKN